MKAGDLRHRVTLQRPEWTTDARGARRTTYVDMAVVYASMADVSGRDFFEAQAYRAQDVVTIGIRWRDDVDTSWRLVHGNVAYEILAINHLGYRRDYLHIKARQTRGEGT